MATKTKSRTSKINNSKNNLATMLFAVGIIAIVALAGFIVWRNSYAGTTTSASSGAIANQRVLSQMGTSINQVVIVVANPPADAIIKTVSLPGGPVYQTDCTINTAYKNNSFKSCIIPENMSLETLARQSWSIFNNAKQIKMCIYGTRPSGYDYLTYDVTSDSNSNPITSIGQFRFNFPGNQYQQTIACANNNQPINVVSNLTGVNRDVTKIQRGFVNLNIASPRPTKQFEIYSIVITQVE